MSEEIKMIRRQLSEIRQLLEENELTNDLINRRKAIELLGVSPAYFQNLLNSGKIKRISKNEAGQQFFSRKQLLGISNLKIA